MMRCIVYDFLLFKSQVPYKNFSFILMVVLVFIVHKKNSYSLQNYFYLSPFLFWAGVYGDLKVLRIWTSTKALESSQKFSPIGWLIRLLFEGKPSNTANLKLGNERSGGPNETAVKQRREIDQVGLRGFDGAANGAVSDRPQVVEPPSAHQPNRLVK